MSAAAGWWLLLAGGYKEEDDRMATVLRCMQMIQQLFVCLLALVLPVSMEGAGLGRSEDTNEDEEVEKAPSQRWGLDGGRRGLM